MKSTVKPPAGKEAPATSAGTSEYRATLEPIGMLLDKGLWPKGYPPRSAPYRAGFFAGYEWAKNGKIKGTLSPCPHEQGSVEFDAWFSGKEAGERQAGG